MSEIVERILSNYESEPPGVVAKLRQMLEHGTLGGTGKMVILPVDQGFEHGPGRSFEPNPPGYDPFYHAELAIKAGCNAYAAPLGFIEAVARKYAGRLPLILKVNNSDLLGTPPAPHSALTSSVKDALRLGCVAVGFTIYPGSAARNSMYEQARDLIREAREAGLPTVIWSYPRGGMSKQGETALDVVAYAAHIACQLGAHIIKVKPPTAHIEREDAKKHYEGIPKESLADRVAHVVRAAFNGKRIVIFSGGEAKSKDEVLDEVRNIHRGGGFGSIMGRNAFQRPEKEALELLREVMMIYKG
ncbi:MAG: class I fructose-bisphosphate aldolase [Deltaproteobacteria bacterium]|nr:class I fructose-bisphosphate aldolase [Deltaproteobacteria bacterium]MDW8246581.1 class I fructose-bisphosphate aldolase [Sandaracinaceae bacterium]